MRSEWLVVRLGDHCTKIGSGATPKGGKEAYLDAGPYRLIRSQNVYNEGFAWQGLAFISEEQARKLEGVSVEANDVLVNITGDSVARVCMAPRTVLPARVNQHVAIVRPHATSFDANFLRWFLCIPEQQEKLLGLASAGATRNALTKAMLEGIQVPRPPVEVQRELIAPIVAISERIDLLRETNATLESIAQALFKSWFIDFDPVRAKAEGREPEGMDAATAELFPSDTESWQRACPRVRVSELAASGVIVVGDGYRAKNSELGSPGVCFVRAGDLAHGRITPTEDLLSVEAIAKAQQKVARRGDTAFTSKGTIGRFAYVDESASPAVYSPQVCFWRSNDPGRLSPVYLHYWMKSGLFSGQVDRVRGQAAIMDFVSLGDQRKMLLDLPSSPVQLAFESAVEPLLARSSINRAQADSLVSVRDELLPRLISGKLRILEAKDQLEEAIA